MTRRWVAIFTGGVLAAAVAAVVALRPPADAPSTSAGSQAAEPLGGLRSNERDWRSVLAEASKSGDEDAFQGAVRQGLAREPGATINAVMRSEGFAERAQWALSLWLEADLVAAWGWAAELADGEEPTLLLDALDMFAARDPVAALAAAGRLAVANDRVLLAARALCAWARKDPMGAWLAAQDTALPGDEKGRRRDSEANLWGIDLDLILGFNQEGWRQRRGRLSTAVLDVWAEGGWQEPLAAVAATEGAHVPSAWQEAAIARWAEAEPLAALRWASSLPSFDDADRVAGVVSRREAVGMTLATMAIHWPHKANAAMEEIGNGTNWERQNIYNAGSYRDAIARFAAAAEPRRLAAWFEGNPDAEMRERHAADVTRTYAAAHPQEALAWARRLPEGFQRMNAVWAAVTTITDGDHARAGAMLVGIGDEELLNYLADRLTAGWAKEDPLAAIRWLETHAPKEWDTEERMATFHTWAREDPVAAAAHLPEIADADERAWATHHVITATFYHATFQPGGDDEALRPHLPRIERLYATLPPEARSKHVAYFLYRHYEHTDPQRAARYQAEAGDDHGARGTSPASMPRAGEGRVKDGISGNVGDTPFAATRRAPEGHARRRSLGARATARVR